MGGDDRDPRSAESLAFSCSARHFSANPNNSFLKFSVSASDFGMAAVAAAAAVDFFFRYVFFDNEKYKLLLQETREGERCFFNAITQCLVGMSDLPCHTRINEVVSILKFQFKLKSLNLMDIYRHVTSKGRPTRTPGLCNHLCSMCLHTS